MTAETGSDTADVKHEPNDCPGASTKLLLGGKPLAGSCTLATVEMTPGAQYDSAVLLRRRAAGGRPADTTSVGGAPGGESRSVTAASVEREASSCNRDAGSKPTLDMTPVVAAEALVDATTPEKTPRNAATVPALTGVVGPALTGSANVSAPLAALRAASCASEAEGSGSAASAKSELTVTDSSASLSGGAAAPCAEDATSTSAAFSALESVGSAAAAAAAVASKAATATKMESRSDACRSSAAESVSCDGVPLATSAAAVESSSAQAPAVASVPMGLEAIAALEEMDAATGSSSATMASGLARTAVEGATSTACANAAPAAP